MSNDTGVYRKPRQRRRVGRRRPPRSKSESKLIWSDTKSLVRKGRITPIVSDDISRRLIFGERYDDEVVTHWAEDIEFPWPIHPRLVHVAQHARIWNTGPGARRDYLDQLKYALLNKAEDENIDPQLVKMADENLYTRSYSFTKMARDLGYLQFDSQELKNHPFSMLARLPFTVYFTTSYHQFLELALQQVGNKRPRSEIYPWNSYVYEETVNSSIFRQDPSWKPSENEPLVYHLFGRDDYPESLVITENDYLNMLLELVQERKTTHTGGHTTNDGKPVVRGIPRMVKDKLASTPVLLLGYDLQHWDFRVLFRGLLQQRARSTFDDEGDGICIQYLPDREESEEIIQRKLNEYLMKKSRLKVYWGTSKNCMEDVYKEFYSA